MSNLRLAVCALIGALACQACSSRPEHNHTGPLPIFYSPNGEPLSGGGLGHPHCPDALASWFGRLDGPKRGFIDHDQFLQDAREQFDHMDLGHEGFITSSKLETYRLAFQDRPDYEPAQPGTRVPQSAPAIPSIWHRHGQSADSGTSPSSPLPSPVQSQDVEDPVMSADRSLTFKVTLSDFLVHADEVFGRLDKDHTGRLTLVDVQRTCPAAR